MQDPAELYEEDFVDDDDLDGEQEQELQSLGARLKESFKSTKTHAKRPKTSGSKTCVSTMASMSPRYLHGLMMVAPAPKFL